MGKPGIDDAALLMEVMDSNHLAQSILESAGAGIYAIDREGLCIYINRAAERLFGYTREECMGHNMHRLIHYKHESGSPYPESECRIMSVVRNGAGSRIDDEIIWRKDGTCLPVEYDAKPIVVDGEIAGTVVTVNEITQRKQASAALLEAKAAAEEANLAKSQFLASMSHELRTPLNAIIGYSEMLQEDADERNIDELNADLRRINSAGRHLLSLINDVLDLSKIEAGKVDIFPETFDIAEMADEVAATAEALVLKNGSKLRRDIETGLGSMHSDLTKIRQALFNLLSNAAKFTSGGTVEFSVGTAEQDCIRFSIRDTGIGMAPDKLGQLFQPFSQADRTTARRYGGTGLGLVITKRFIELLGGRVLVESTPGVGSTFTLLVPRNVPEPGEGDETESIEATAPFGGKRVLIVDDDPTARDLMRRQLAREGFETMLARNGHEALQIAKSTLPDLITLDVMMPGMDGWAVLQALKADPALCDIPVVMATIIEDRNLGYILGAADYLVKPIDRDQLRRALVRIDRTNARPVMIVDDDADARQLLRNLLEREGFGVQEAENGRIALQLIKQGKPSLVLLDLLMPVMDGFAFSHQLGLSPENHDIPIVVLTAKDLTPEDRAALHGSVQGVLSKSSFAREELMRHIRGILGRERTGPARAH